MSTGLSRSNPHSPRSRQFRGRSRAASLPLLRCLIRVRITMLADATLSQRQRRPFNACHQPCCSSPMCVEADDDDSGSSGGASVTDGTKRQRVDGMWRTSEGAAPPPHPPLVGNSTAVATALGGASGGASGGAAGNESGGASGGAAGNAAHGARGRGSLVGGQLSCRSRRIYLRVASPAETSVGPLSIPRPFDAQRRPVAHQVTLRAARRTRRAEHRAASPCTRTAAACV